MIKINVTNRSWCHNQAVVPERVSIRCKEIDAPTSFNLSIILSILTFIPVGLCAHNRHEISGMDLDIFSTLKELMVKYNIIHSAFGANKKTITILSLLLLTAMFLALPAQASSIMEPKGMADNFSGKPEAPHTLIVYSSPTCSYCVQFETEILPELKALYVDKGELRISVRPFLRNQLDAAIFMLANAHGPSSFNTNLALITPKIKRVTQAKDPLAELQKVAAEVGIDAAQFNSAMNDKRFLENLNQLTEQAVTAFGVAGTPTFFLDGKPVRYDGTIASLTKSLQKDEE
ncbi:thioredoxin domain-containing protein [Brucella anthropi]|uniref:thioredoxin domain-containing protein n=1 Tax=Brucella anthropi TaxID=529 RepID=UPI00398665C7